MAEPHFRWPPLPSGVSQAQLVQRLNQYLPQIAPAMERALRLAQESALRYVTVEGEIIDRDPVAGTVTVRASGSVPPALTHSVCAPDGVQLASIQVQLAELNGAVAVVSGPAVGVWSPNNSTWVLSQPQATEGPGRVTFLARLEGAEPGRDSVVIPEVGNEQAFLSGVALVARAVLSTDFLVVVELTLRATGEEPPTQGRITIDSWTGLDAGDAVPLEIEGMLPLTQSFAISRPLFKGGTGRATWYGESIDIPGALPDYAELDVPEIQQDTIPLALRVRVVPSASTESVLVVDAIATDPRDEGAPSIAVESYDGTGGAPSVVSDTVAGSTRTTRYSIPKAALLGRQGRVIFRADLAGRISSYDPVEVPERGVEGVHIEIDSTVQTLAHQLRVVIHAIDPLGGAPVSYEVWEVVGIPGSITGSGTAADPYVIPKPGVGEPQGRVKIRGWKTGRIQDFEWIDVAPMSRDTAAVIVKLRQVGKSATHYAFAVDATDPVDGSLASYEVVEGAAGVTGAGTNASPYLVPRPAFGAGAARFTVRGFKAGRAEGTDSAEVTPVERDTFPVEIELAEAYAVEGETGERAVEVIARDPLGVSVPTISAPVHLGLHLVQLVSDFVTGPGERTHLYRIIANRDGATKGRIDWTASGAGMKPNSKGMDVPPWIYTGAPSLQITYLAANAADYSILDILWEGHTCPAGTQFRGWLEAMRDGVLVPMGGDPPLVAARKVTTIHELQPQGTTDDQGGFDLGFLVYFDNPTGSRETVRLYARVEAYFQGRMIGVAVKVLDWYWTPEPV